MLLPEPVPPTIAVIAPGSNTQVISLQDGLLGPRVAELDVHQLDAAGLRKPLGPASAGSAISGSVPSTSWMRSAEAAARGTIIIVITAIITENRICMM